MYTLMLVVTLLLQLQVTLPPTYGKSSVVHLVLNTSARLPNPKLTPGKATNETKEQLCSKTFHTADVRIVPDSLKTSVYRAYGVAVNTSYCKLKPYVTRKGKTVMQGCEVDHLISLELGGANDIKNLWPQPYGENPGAHQKDVVENWLHTQVCTGKVSLQQAQHDIAENWFAVYLRMIKSK